MGGGTHNFIADADLIRSNDHGLFNGNQVTYHQNNGLGIDGLLNEEIYTVVRKDADFFSLTQNGVAIDLTSIGNGAETFTTQSGVITTSSIEGAIAINASNRAELGARLNTLSYAIDNLQTLSNNLSQAYSRIMDVDYAAETAALTRNQILQQAATSMLAQANQMPNVILTLLK
jgi:flagellin-like hook-associated protein FlgL